MDKAARKEYDRIRRQNMTPEQKEAELARLTKWRDDNPDRLAEAKREYNRTDKAKGLKAAWRDGNRGHISDHAKKKWREDVDASRRRQREKNARYRADLMDILGGPRCAWCGLDWAPALTFDHIHDDGASERRAGLYRNTTHMVTYYRARPADARQRLQVLCGSCNLAKERYMLRFRQAGVIITYEMVRAAPWC